MIRYSRACGSYQDFLDRGLLLTRKLLNQGFLLVKLKSSLRKCYGRHHDLVDHYGISVFRSFPYSRLITGFVTRLTRRCHQLSRNCLSFRSTSVHPRFLVGFVLQIVVCPFVLFLLAIVSVLRYTDSYCTNKKNALRDNFSLLNLKLALVFVNTERKLCLFSITGTLFLIFLTYM